jgi:hypothetical protein
VPVAAFLTRDFRCLYRYVEYPAVYHKDPLAAAMQARATRPGDTQAQAFARFIEDWGALQQSPFFAIWTSATVNEILATLYERVLTGEPSPEAR